MNFKWFYFIIVEVDSGIVDFIYTLMLVSHMAMIMTHDWFRVTSVG